MKCIAVLLALCAAATAAPQPYRPIFGIGGGYGGGYGGGTADGRANANVVAGSQQGPFGGSRITSLNANAAGTASGGGSSVNSASASQSSSNRLYGNSNHANTYAHSAQNTQPGFLG